MSIFVSLAEPTVEACLESLKPIRFAEVRLDGMCISPEDVRRVFSLPKTLIATHRPGERTLSEREELMLAAIGAGAAYVDIEDDAPMEYRDALIDRARAVSCKVIVSFHDHDGTPDRSELEACISRCQATGADIVKIACRVTDAGDNARLLGLLDGRENLVVVGMGPMGRITRIVAPLLGYPLAYAAPSTGRTTAPGQLDETTLRGWMTELSSV